MRKSNKCTEFEGFIGRASLSAFFLLVSGIALCGIYLLFQARGLEAIGCFLLAHVLRVAASFTLSDFWERTIY